MQHAANQILAAFAHARQRTQLHAQSFVQDSADAHASKNMIPLAITHPTHALGQGPGLSLLIANVLRDPEILNDKVATLILLKLKHHCFLVLVGPVEINLWLGLLLGSLEDGLALLLDGCVGLLHNVPV